MNSIEVSQFYNRNKTDYGKKLFALGYDNVLKLSTEMWGLSRLLSVNSIIRIPHILRADIHSVAFTPKPILLRRDCKLLNKRTFFRIFRRPTKEQYKISDNVPSEYLLIYRNTMDRYLLLVQLITTVTGSLVVLSTVMKHDFPEYKLIFAREDTIPRRSHNEIFVYLATFVGIVILLQLLLSKLPLRIYYLSQQQKYIFVFPGPYPTAIRKLTCKVGDVNKLPPSGISLWKEDKYHIKNKQDVIMLEHYFRRPADLHVMTGIQKDPNVVDK